MEERLEIKSPWTMIHIEYADDFIAQIKDALPPDHEIQNHESFPGIKLRPRTGAEINQAASDSASSDYLPAEWRRAASPGHSLPSRSNQSPGHRSQTPITRREGRDGFQSQPELW